MLLLSMNSTSESSHCLYYVAVCVLPYCPFLVLDTVNECLDNYQQLTGAQSNNNIDLDKIQFASPGS